MKILAHRGFWLKKKEQNTLAAFKRAVDQGYGIETDFRDHKGKLVISHDVVSKNPVRADKAFKIFSKIVKNQDLAVNIKTDGLQKLIKSFLGKHRISNYFIFDASIPDLRDYKEMKFKFYGRLSEMEEATSIHNAAHGIWLDAFHSQWYSVADILKWLRKKKNVAIVSPELHGRNFKPTWQLLKDPKLNKYQDQLGICTDFPMEADLYFNKKNNDY